MGEYVKDFTNFIKNEILIKDFLAPIRVFALLYILIWFYLPIGWNFIKNSILLLLNPIYSGPLLEKTNGISLFVMWWFYIIDLCVVGYLFYIFIKALNKKGIKKLTALFPLLAFLLFILFFTAIVSMIDEYIPFIHLYNTLVIIEGFLI